jgi:hypothetical protein
VDEHDVSVLGVSEEYKKVYVLALTVAKWSPDRGVRQGRGQCVLCFLYGYVGKNSCVGCPAQIGRKNCNHSDHFWKKWIDMRKEKVYADKLYWHLMSQYEKEYNRLVRKGLIVG